MSYIWERSFLHIMRFASSPGRPCTELFRSAHITHRSMQGLAWSLLGKPACLIALLPHLPLQRGESALHMVFELGC